MKETEFEERVWNVFVHICDKQNLDLKADNIKDYRVNFESAFNKAYNVVTQYYSMKKDVDMSSQHIN